MGPYFYQLPEFTSDSTVNSGNVNPCRFVKITGESLGGHVTTEGFSAIGVTMGFTDRPPNDGSLATATFIATSNRPVPYHGYGAVCNLELGGTITTAGDRIISSTTGTGLTAVSASTGKLCNAIALRAGTIGELVPVYVTPPMPIGATYN